MQNVDFINDQVRKIEAGATEDDDATDLINENRAFLERIKGGKTPDTAKDGKMTIELDPSPTSDNSKSDKETQHAFIYKARIHFSDGSEMENIRAFSIINNLDEIAEDIHHVPEDLMVAEAADVIKQDGFNFTFKSNYSYVDVHQLLMQTVFLKELELEQLIILTRQKMKKKKSTSETKKKARKLLKSKIKQVLDHKPKDKGQQLHQSIISVPVDKLISLWT